MLDSASDMESASVFFEVRLYASRPVLAKLIDDVPMFLLFSALLFSYCIWFGVHLVLLF